SPWSRVPPPAQAPAPAMLSLEAPPVTMMSAPEPQFVQKYSISLRIGDAEYQKLEDIESGTMSSFNIAVPEKDGWSFDGWYTAKDTVAGGSCVVDGNGNIAPAYTDESGCYAPTGDLILYARYSKSAFVPLAEGETITEGTAYAISHSKLSGDGSLTTLYQNSTDTEPYVLTGNYPTESGVFYDAGDNRYETYYLPGGALSFNIAEDDYQYFMWEASYNGSGLKLHNRKLGWDLITDGSSISAADGNTQDTYIWRYDAASSRLYAISTGSSGDNSVILQYYLSLSGETAAPNTFATEVKLYKEGTIYSFS
ncbi:MAG: hypothetical protein Q4E57_01755, partial [Eubacteriales bacterium]|nr:hypothetical protein [Eubacteriales bacterium]